MTEINKIMQITILYCQINGYTINPLKLHKLLYFIQAWHIALFEKDTLWEELPEAWVNGPVYRSIYNLFKKKFYRNENFRYKDDGEKLPQELKKAVEESRLSALQQNFIFDVLNVYAPMSDEKLVLSTHQALPWNKAREGYSPVDICTNRLSIDDMYEYYTKRINR